MKCAPAEVATWFLLKARECSQRAWSNCCWFHLPLTGAGGSEYKGTQLIIRESCHAFGKFFYPESGGNFLWSFKHKSVCVMLACTHFISTLMKRQSDWILEWVLCKHTGLHCKIQLTIPVRRVFHLVAKVKRVAKEQKNNFLSLGFIFKHLVGLHYLTFFLVCKWKFTW